MVEASSFRILGPISSGPIALCGLRHSNILCTPVSVMSMEFMVGKGDVLGNSPWGGGVGQLVFMLKHTLKLTPLVI